MSARGSIGWLAWWLMWVISASAADRAYWVWQRSEALTEAESAELHHQGVSTLYWHTATVNASGSAFAHAPEPAKLAPGFRVVPVVRVEMTKLPPRDQFLKLARFAADGALQLDFDLPDRLLGDYAEALADLRQTVPHLGITALAHWPRVKEFPALARSVEELCPMFYDLQSDPTGVSAEAPPPPLLDPAQVAEYLAAWKSCPTRWRAGLPTFARLTIFDETGLSRGQIPAWEWDEVAFHAHLRTLAPTKLGVTLLRADAPLTVAHRTLRESEILAVRTTDAAVLAACVQAVENSGAAGLVLFRLPARESDATSSLKTLGAASARDATAPALPKLVLKRVGDTLLLQNEGAADLPPRLSGERHDRDRGYAIEIEAPAAVFREAEAGEFFRVGAHVGGDEKPVRASIQSATRLTLWFSHLDAGATLHSGFFQLAPAAAPGTLRWRLAGGEWQPLHIP